MKTKLLKKVRKQYSIYRVDGYNTTPELFSEIAYLDIVNYNKLKLPFYEVRWRWMMLSTPILKQTKQEAIDAIIECIRDEYKPKIKKEKYKSEKVWWQPAKPW